MRSPWSDFPYTVTQGLGKDLARPTGQRVEVLLDVLWYHEMKHVSPSSASLLSGWLSHKNILHVKIQKEADGIRKRGMKGSDSAHCVSYDVEQVRKGKQKLPEAREGSQHRGCRSGRLLGKP